jgi:hypothetical protein
MIGMRVVLTIARWLVRLIGVLLLIMGLLIWTQNNFSLINSHLLLGVLLVVSMLVVAVVSTQLGAPLGMAAGLAVAAIIVLAFGMTQDSILPGPNHWIIQVLHPLVGLGGVGFSEAVCGRVQRARLASAVA